MHLISSIVLYIYPINPMLTRDIFASKCAWVQCLSLLILFHIYVYIDLDYYFVLVNQNLLICNALTADIFLLCNNAFDFY